MTFPAATNLSNLGDLWSYADEVGGFFNLLVLISIYIVVLLYSLRIKENVGVSSFVVAGFVVSFVAIFLRLAQFINNGILYIAFFSLTAPLLFNYLIKN